MMSGSNGWLQSSAPVLPAMVVLLYFVIGFGAFGVRALLWGVPRDHEIESRGQSILVTLYLRNYFIWVTRPLWRLLLASGVSANFVTGSAAALGVLASVAVAAGWFALGGWLFLFSGILDAMDGRLARARGQIAPAGTVIDSVLDRYTDAMLLIGLCWYFRASWVLLPALAALLGTSLVPYVRAKAEALGVKLRGGLMQRPERVLYLGGALVFTPVVELTLQRRADPHPFPGLVALGILFLAVTTHLTAVQRLVELLHSLSRPAPAEPDRDLHARRGRGRLSPRHP
jgi:phosphatidylglycerophosphate synthase